jgi:hypothetical protein
MNLTAEGEVAPSQRNQRDDGKARNSKVAEPAEGGIRVHR